MVITILEAQVESEQWEAFKRTFEASTMQLPPSIRETYLIQAHDQKLWRIVTVWRSREALNEMRASGQTPEGVRMFRSVGAEPTLSIFDVIVHAPE